MVQSGKRIGDNDKLNKKRISELIKLLLMKIMKVKKIFFL